MVVFFVGRKVSVTHHWRADKLDLMVRSRKVIRFARSDFFSTSCPLLQMHRVEPEHLIQHELVRCRRFDLCKTAWCAEG